MLRIAICDETPQETEQLAKTLRAYAAEELAIECFATLTKLKKATNGDINRYRLLILGTTVAEEDGIAAAKALRKMGCTSELIFYSAETERTAEAYAAFPTCFLPKPSPRNRICEVISFIAARYGQKTSIILNGGDGRRNGFCTDDIIYIEVFRTELDVHTAAGATKCIGSLSETCEKLPEGRFYRAHRSFIVNLARVKSLEKYQFTMDNGDEVTVAKNRYAEAKAAWRDFCSHP
jgi:DNA-binding LytR/AlgR family response regulator